MKQVFSPRPKNEPIAHGRKPQAPCEEIQSEGVTFVSLILLLFCPQPYRALWEIQEGGVLTLIKFEFPALGRGAAGLRSHHPETLPCE